MNVFRAIATALALSTACLSSVGCSAMSFLHGWIVDATSPDEIVIYPSGAHTIVEGTKVVVLLKDGSTATGSFVDLESRWDRGYDSTFDGWHRSLNASGYFPRRGDSIVVIRDRLFGRTVTGRLAGFDHRTLYIRVSGQLESESLASISTMADVNGNSVSGKRISRVIDSTDVPLMGTALIAREKDTLSLPLHTVSIFRAEVIPDRKYSYFVTGAIFDVAVLALLSLIGY
jgi:hypothetical protein